MKLTYFLYQTQNNYFFGGWWGITERKNVFETLHGVKSKFINQI